MNKHLIIKALKYSIIFLAVILGFFASIIMTSKIFFKEKMTCDELILHRQKCEKLAENTDCYKKYSPTEDVPKSDKVCHFIAECREELERNGGLERIAECMYSSDFFRNEPKQVFG
ncbi:hypothetical protein ACFL3V_07215 [Nanoarchaeota archaeon]